MRLLTPAEYADAYRFWTQQNTRTHAIEVHDQIAPHIIALFAEKARVEALMRWRDTPEQIAARRAGLQDADRTWSARNKEAA